MFAMKKDSLLRRWTPALPARAVARLLMGFLLCVWLAALPATLLATAGHAQDVIPIYLIQGSGAASPLDGARVSTSGVVTAIHPRGFHLQDPAGDGDPATSDGIYVYTNQRPAVTLGGCVLVRTAQVDEYYEKTELVKAAAVEPSDLCRSTTVAGVPLPLPVWGGDAARFEPLEGMLVSLPESEAIAMGPTHRWNTGDVETPVIWRSQRPFLPGSRVMQADSGDMGLLVYLSALLTPGFPDADRGDRLQWEPGAQAIVDYNCEKVQLLLLPGTQVTRLAARRSGDPVALERMAPAGDDEITICSANQFAMGSGSDQFADPQIYAAELGRRAQVIAEVLAGCTVVGLQEVGVVADAQALADRLGTEYGLPYQAVALPSPQSYSSEFPLTNAVLVRSDRVTVTAAHSAQGCSPVDYGVNDPDFSCPLGAYPLFDRPPLVVDLQVKGAWGTPVTLRLIDNHWKSKAGNEALNAKRRMVQAQQVAALAQTAQQRGVPVVIAGDLNDYLGSAPVEAVRTGVTPALRHTYDYLPESERATYIFNGGSQVLDHMLVSEVLAPWITEVNVAHINSDFAPRTGVRSLLHSSDHDPVLLRLRPAGGGFLSLATGVPGVTVQNEAGDRVAVSDEFGELRLWNLPPGVTALRLSGPALGPADAHALTVTVNGGEVRAVLTPDGGVVGAALAAIGLATGGGAP